MGIALRNILDSGEAHLGRATPFVAVIPREYGSIAVRDSYYPCKYWGEGGDGDRLAKAAATHAL